MRIGKTDRFWVVTDARRGSELCDILFETNIEGLAQQFKGGLTAEDNPTLFTSAEEAECEATLFGSAIAVRLLHRFLVANGLAAHDPTHLGPRRGCTNPGWIKIWWWREGGKIYLSFGENRARN